MFLLAKKGEQKKESRALIKTSKKQDFISMKKDYNDAINGHTLNKDAGNYLL